MSAQSLSGVRVLVTRARHQAEGLSSELEKLGADVVEIPLIEIAPPLDFGPIDDALRNLSSRYDWLIVTSANAAEVLLDRAKRVGASLIRTRIAAIGSATARSIESRGLRVDHVPETADAESIGAGLGDLTGRRILLAQADIARRATGESLRKRGATVDVMTTYRTVTATDSRDDLQRELKRGVDVVAFMSSSAVTAFISLGGRELAGKARMACIGNLTAETARANGLHADIVAPAQTSAALAETIARELRTST